MKSRLIAIAIALIAMTHCARAVDHGRDRGAGTPTSMFGTYINKGQILIYPFFEYYYDQNVEYSPQELGYVLDEDYRGKYRSTEGLIFVGYGLTQDISLEFEGAITEARLQTAPSDPTDVPDRIEESGIGDVQTQINVHWLRETDSHPGFFSYLETVFPTQKKKVLIGTGDWEFKAGTGIVRGFSFGTMTLRGAFEYSRAEDKFELGEVAVEYLRRLSQKWRVYMGVEGTQDEVELITEAQWHLSPHAFVKLNNAFGVTSKATDWAPEVGVMFSIPTDR